VARSIAQEIRVTLSPRERTRLAQSRPVTAEAHTAYLKGLYNWNKRTTTSIQKAIEYFRQSSAIDPNYALPYVGLATCYAVLPSYDRQHAKEALHDCRVAALKAMELDSTLGEPHAVLAGVLSEDDWDQQGAEVEYKRAIALNPNYASVHQWYADFLSCLGRQEEAITEIKRALELDPLSLIINTEYGSILARSGNYDLAIETLRNTIEMDPSFPRAHETLGVVYGFAGKYIESTWELQAQDSLLGSKSSAEAAAWYGPLRNAFRESGEKGYYRQLLKQRLALAKKEYVPPIKIALSYARLGEKDSAFIWLDRAIEARDPYVLRIPVEPHWDSLRSDPRYAAVMKRIGFPL
jgi:tetratricopeptide (TPR) repeat protein